MAEAEERKSYANCAQTCTNSFYQRLAPLLTGAVAPSPHSNALTGAGATRESCQDVGHSEVMTSPRTEPRRGAPSAMGSRGGSAKEERLRRLPERRRGGLPPRPAGDAGAASTAGEAPALHRHGMERGSLTRVQAAAPCLSGSTLLARVAQHTHRAQQQPNTQCCRP